MYCEATLPGSTKVPGRMRPLVLSGKPPRPCRSQPAATISSESGERGCAEASLTHKGGLCAQRAGDGQHKAECGAAFAAVKRAAGKGLEQAKLNTLHGGVDLEAVLDGLDAGTRAVRQRTVASMSAQVVLQVTCVSPLASAAQIIKRCAIDLDAMAGTVPLSGTG